MNEGSAPESAKRSGVLNASLEITTPTRLPASSTQRDSGGRLGGRLVDPRSCVAGHNTRRPESQAYTKLASEAAKTISRATRQANVCPGCRTRKR